MSVQNEFTAVLTGVYVVGIDRCGDGIDYYLTVTGPDGRSTEQKVYWTYSMTAHQVVEEAVSAHLGRQDWHRSAATSQDQGGGYLVSVG